MPIDLNSLSPRAQAARAFAIEAHGEQRYGKHPYIVHLDAVVEQILRFEPAAGQDTIADRIANVSACWAERSKLLFMYRQEYTQFRAGLHSNARGVEQAMWQELDALMGWD